MVRRAQLPEETAAVAQAAADEVGDRQRGTLYQGAREASLIQRSGSMGTNPVNVMRGILSRCGRFLVFGEDNQVSCLTGSTPSKSLSYLDGNLTAVS